MQMVALALFCKTPRAGQSKTRLSPRLTPTQCADLSAAFICDVGVTVHAAAVETNAVAYAVFTPSGSEAELRPLLPQSFHFLAQGEGDLGARLIAAMNTLFAAGHRGVIFINADGPTLPLEIVSNAARIVRSGLFAIGPALDGGYTLIGLPAPNNGLFTDIAWSTPAVFRQTKAKASQFGIDLHELPIWYDVDDAADLHILKEELATGALPFTHDGIMGGPAPATRAFLARLAQEQIGEDRKNLVS